MRTIEQFKAENEKIILENTENGRPKYLPTSKESIKANNALELNKKCIRALEQGLTQEKLEKQLDERLKRLNWIDDETIFKVWEKSTPCTWKGTNKKHWEQVNGRADVVKQVKFLEYILQ